MRVRVTILVGTLFLAALRLGADAGSPRFSAEFTDAEVAPYANASLAVCREWYSKIEQILFGPGHSCPYGEIRIIFGEQKLAGFTNANTIHISSPWVKQPHALDYRAVVIHELTHIIQDYVLRFRCDGWRALPCFFEIRFARDRTPEWLTEGIADYVTYTYFTKNNEPRMRLDQHGYLFGYDDTIPYLFGLQQGKIRPDGECPERKVRAGKGYRHGYTVASAFLLWLEVRKDKNIVRELNAALNQRHYSARLFRRCCGAPVDQLWREFLAESTQVRRATE